MAKLEPYYGLCPLIDRRSLLGISEDTEEDNVIVTLGENIAIKFTVKDQKQITSWRTKEKFSSPVLYDKTLNKYVAVFNHSYLKLWENDTDNLDKLKKVRFKEQIRTMVLSDGVAYVLFKNGACYKLNELLQLDNLPQINVGMENFNIEDILATTCNGQFYLGYLVKSDEFYLYWSKNCSNKFNKIALYRENCTAMGVMFYPEQNNYCSLLSIWDDGKIFLHDLSLSQDNMFLFGFIKEMNMSNKVLMVYLDESYIGLYGASINDEGASLVLYNTQFKNVQSRQCFKMYTSDSKLWCIKNKIYIPIGQNLAVVPFHLGNEKLGAIIGNQAMQNEIVDGEIKVTSWDKEGTIIEKEIPVGLKNKEKYIKQGYSEFAVIKNIVADILEKGNIQLLSHTIENFSQMPEKELANILKFLLTSKKDVFKKGSGNIKVQNSLPTSLLLLQKYKLLNKILNKCYPNITLQTHLNALLTIDDIAVLLEYCLFNLSESSDFSKLKPKISEERLLGWACLFVDLVFQKNLIVENENILMILEEINDILKSNFKICLNYIPATLEYCKNIDKPLQIRDSAVSELEYFVEQITLY